MPEGSNSKLRSARESTPSRLISGHSMSRTELAQLVADHVLQHSAISVPVDRKYIARLEAGRIRWPNDRYRRALREILGARSDADLGFYSDHLARAAVRLDEGATTQDVMWSWTPAGAIDAVTAVEVAMDRRDVLRLIPGAVLVQLATEWLVAPSAASAAKTSRFRVTHVQVDALEQFIDDLRRTDDRQGGGAVLALARAQVRAVGDLLRDGTFDDSVGRRLHAVSAELFRFLGWLYWDAQDYPRAQRAWTAAMHASQVAGDNLIGANVLSFWSGQADEAGDHATAVGLGALATSRVNGSPKAIAIAQFQLAIAAAGAGQNRECRAAIDAAMDALDAPSPSEGEPPWAYWIAANQEEMRGRCHWLLGDTDAAIDDLQAFVAGAEGRERARGLGFLAQAHIAGGDPAQASHVAIEALDLLDDGDVLSPRCVAHLRRVRDALDPFDVPEVDEFRERLELLA